MVVGMDPSPESVDLPSESESDSDIEHLGRALSSFKTYLFRYSAEMVVVSVCWFVASLPLVTIGPATVAAYATIGSLLEDGELRLGNTVAIVRKQFFAATVLSLFPAMFGVGTVVLFLQYLQTGNYSAAVFAIVSLYAWMFSVLVLIPTFVALSQGDWIGTALRRGYLWVVHHPTLSMIVALLTLVVLVGTALLTVGFVLLFGGIAFAVHYTVIVGQL